MHPLQELIDNINECERFNRWFSFDEFHLKAYIRLTNRYIKGEVVMAIDMANVEVDAEYQRKGHFTKFINELESIAKHTDRILYVESIQHEYLYDSLLKRGYQEIDTSNFNWNVNLFKKV